jgi:hypothetical protein
MKTDHVFTGVEWDSNDIPAVIPKRLWDSLISLQEAIIEVGEASCGAAQRTIAAIRQGTCVDEAQLAVLDKTMTEQLADLATEKKEVHRLRSFLKWVPPVNVGTTH